MQGTGEGNTISVLRRHAYDANKFCTPSNHKFGSAESAARSVERIPVIWRLAGGQLFLTSLSLVLAGAFLWRWRELCGCVHLGNSC